MALPCDLCSWSFDHRGHRGHRGNLEAFMSNTIQKYKDYVMTGFLNSLAPIVIDRASGCTVVDANGREDRDCFYAVSVVDVVLCNPQVIASAIERRRSLEHDRS